MNTTRLDSIMRIFWIIIALLLLFLLSVALARKSVELRSPARLAKNPTPFEWLIAGYKEIPAAAPVCAGQPTGRIEIRLENVLDKLRSGETVYRNMTFVPTTTGTGPGQILPVNVERIKGFPTNLDFKTIIQKTGVTEPLVGPNTYVVVRVILEQRTQTSAGKPNDNTLVEFLHQKPSSPPTPGQPPDIESDSRFAVLQGYGVDEPMFFCRQRIMVDADQNPYVDFAVRSVDKAYSGSFGIGLLVRDLNGKSVVPIILDPQVENEG